MDQREPPSPDQGIASIQTLEIVVALILLALAGVVIYDSLRLGVGWTPSQGPASGAFPFYMAVGITVASVVNLLQALRSRAAAQTPFLSRTGLKNIASVLGPLAVYVGLIEVLGVYVAAALLIGGFMVVIGREPIWKSALVGLTIPLVFYVMFERWFLVPLPKGPLEAAFGIA